jgi:FdhD protein
MNIAAIPVPISKVEGQTSSRADDLLAVEEPLEIRLGEQSLSITMRTPGNDLELATGFLFSEGIIRDITQIRSIEKGPQNIVVVDLDQESAALVQPRRNFPMNSACGVCGKASLEDLAANACPVLRADHLQIEPNILHELPSRLRDAQNVFDRTGGLHAAALFDLEGKLESLREDIGRHNAVDKLIGAALADHRMPLNKSILLVSGRASFELVQKALMAGIPIMAAVGAPSSLAVGTALRSGMTLVGFLRNCRFNVYSGTKRILTS